MGPFERLPWTHELGFCVNDPECTGEGEVGSPDWTVSSRLWSSESRGEGGQVGHLSPVNDRLSSRQGLEVGSKNPKDTWTAGRIAETIGKRGRSVPRP